MRRVGEAVEKDDERAVPNLREDETLAILGRNRRPLLSHPRNPVPAVELPLEGADVGLISSVPAALVPRLGARLDSVVDRGAVAA